MITLYTCTHLVLEKFEVVSKETVAFRTAKEIPDLMLKQIKKHKKMITAHNEAVTKSKVNDIYKKALENFKIDYDYSISSSNGDTRHEFVYTKKVYLEPGEKVKSKVASSQKT